jgi:hypothetical protein
MDLNEWCVEMWGTKWNAYETLVVSETEVLFETAWSPTHPLIERLVEQSNVYLLHEWSDENTGYNVGRTYKPDAKFEEFEMTETNEGYELSFKLWPDNPEYYEFDDVTYRCKDEDEE